MMRRLTLILSITIVTLQLHANNPRRDTSYWKSKYESALGFSQTTMTNWAQGGENSVSGNFILNVFKDYNRKNISWNNYLGIAFGLSKQKSYSKPRKTDDKINFQTKGGLYAWKHWDYTGLFEFRSQIKEGFTYPDDSNHISRFMAPGYFQLSLGMNYKPVSYFSVFVSPIGARLTVVNDSYLTNRTVKGKVIGAFGVVGDNTTLWQVGGSLNVIFKKDIMKNINLLSKLDVFSNYRKNPLNLIIGWENNILMKVNKYISLNMSSMLKYDDNEPYKDKEGKIHGPRLQFRETFGIGLAYTIFH